MAGSVESCIRLFNMRSTFSVDVVNIEQSTTLASDSIN
jgi:hypothetical protein